MSESRLKQEDLEALNNFVNEIEDIGIHRKSNTGHEKSRYSIIFKQFTRKKKQTYRSDLNLTNMRQKFGSLVTTEVVAIMFLFANQSAYWQWCNIYDNNMPEGPEREVFHYTAKDLFLINKLFRASEIEKVTQAVKAIRQRRKANNQAPSNEVPKQRNVKALFNQISKNFAV